MGRQSRSESIAERRTLAAVGELSSLSGLEINERRSEVQFCTLVSYILFTASRQSHLRPNGVECGRPALHQLPVL